MRKKLLGIVAICLVVIVIVSTFFVIREVNYSNGKEQGYLIGYFIGYTDKVNGEKQNSQELAGSIVPYELGNAKWKGFMMGFPEGYSDGYSGNKLAD